jgi:hypothetical protein
MDIIGFEEIAQALVVIISREVLKRILQMHRQIEETQGLAISNFLVPKVNLWDPWKC